MRLSRAASAAALLAYVVLSVGSTTTSTRAATPVCDLSQYRAVPGLSAISSADGLRVTWDGDGARLLRAHFAVVQGVPTIVALEARASSGTWRTVASALTPDYRVVSGLRRMTNQQLDPLAGLGVPITKDVIEANKWEAFWDAPLYVPGGEAAHNNTTPPQRGVLDQPGLPRQASEIVRASAEYHVSSCAVTTDGARISVSFPGVTLGVFEGRLQFTIFKGTGLIAQEVVARTSSPAVAYKYDAGVTGLTTAGARLSWTDVEGRPQSRDLAQAGATASTVLRTKDRIVVASTAGGAIAALPPPHTFFWARETSYNLGYDYYRVDAAGTFGFGVRQAESEEPPEVEDRGTEDRHQNFALRSARPGTWQRMPVYLYVTAGDAAAAHAGAAAFTRADRFKPLPGHQVMATHFHMNLVARAKAAGGLGAKVPDLEVLKAAGITIAAPIDGAGGFVPSLAKGGDPALGGDDPAWLKWSRGLGAIQGDPERGGLPPPGSPGELRPRTGNAAQLYAAQAEYYETARQQSSASFVVMPNSEMIRGDVTRALGGHSDLFISRPLFWNQGREPGQPFAEPHPTYGTVYHVTTTAEMIEMARRERLLLFMPHPRTKGSAGYPDAIRTEPYFVDPVYRGAGFRWGMGLDGSESRLCEYRCLPLLDDMNNWVAHLPTPPKYLQATSELYQQGVGDDVYANNPVNYVRLGALPRPGDWTPIVDAMASGDYFVTSGEVLIPSYAVRGTGTARTIVADVEWTFPLDLVEVVWGDGTRTDRRIIRATDLPPHGSHHFEIPFDATGKAWVRFAAWDTAGNGAFVMPVKLTP